MSNEALWADYRMFDTWCALLDYAVAIGDADLEEQFQNELDAINRKWDPAHLFMESK